jgi:hypothetical protein
MKQTGLISVSTGGRGEFCQHGNELLGSIKCRELCDFRLLPQHT